MLIASLTSCSNDDVLMTDPIIGEWNLTSVEYYGENSDGMIELFSIDYSDENIVYNFNSNSQLIVSGEDHIGFENGAYTYIFEEDYLSGFPNEGETKMLLVKVNGFKWTYEFTNGTMQLGNSYVDGPNLYFERK